MTPTGIVIAALGCKRPAYDAGWLTSLHLPNVTLNSVGIASITETSIIDTTGKEFQADVIVFATGSDVARHGVGLNVGLYGEDGVELKEFWKEIGGPQSYRGLAVPGVSPQYQPGLNPKPHLSMYADAALPPNLTRISQFPNYFMTLGPNAIAGSWGYTIGNQTTVIARLIKEMLDLGIGSLQPDRSYFDAHNAEIQEKLDGSTMNSQACSNWWRIGGRGRLSVPNPLDASES
jgi:cation diffusion facilitator CzcD-associated flavoprotein CzcO